MSRGGYAPSASGPPAAVRWSVQSIRGYGPLDTGLRILPVAISLALFSLIGPRLAMVLGSKIVVALGLASLSTAFFWASTIGQDTSYLEIMGQMVLLGGGLGLTSAPATEAIMGVVPPEKAGMGSSVNDATRELGGTLGVAVIGSVSLSMYRDHLGHPPVPDALIEPARESIGAAEEAARQAAEMGELARLAGEQVLVLAREGFVQGFAIGCIVAGAVTAVAAILTLVYLPAHPVNEDGERA